MAAKQPRRIVLTGVTRGLGLALAKKFIGLDHTVLGCGRSQEAIDRLQQAFGPPQDFTVVDVSQREQVEEWADRLLDRYGVPDLLLSNAAVITPNAPFWEVPGAEFDRLIDVNIKGTANVLRSFLPAMIAQGRGVVVDFSSGWGRSTSPEVAPYCASKWAVEGLTRALAQELPPGLAAVPLNPGVIDTDMLRSCFGQDAAEYPSAEEWAERAAPFLLGLGPDDNGKPLTVPS
jgi:NAD(P)-dependent dehydrogenase (short-subunit alcohol dehydrogenase family)